VFTSKFNASDVTYDIAVSSLPVESSLITDHINMAKPTGINKIPANKPTRGEVALLISLAFTIF
jgi:hypothetical protein